MKSSLRRKWVTRENECRARRAIFHEALLDLEDVVAAEVDVEEADEALDEPTVEDLEVVERQLLVDETREGIESSGNELQDLVLRQIEPAQDGEVLERPLVEDLDGVGPEVEFRQRRETFESPGVDPRQDVEREVE